MLLTLQPVEGLRGSLILKVHLFMGCQQQARRNYGEDCADRPKVSLQYPFLRPGQECFR